MILKIIILSLFISRFQPLQDLFDKFFGWLNSESTLIDYLYIGVGCPKCLSFWITLGATFNPITAMATSLVVMVLNKIIERI